MKISHKMILAALAILIVIGILGYASIAITQKALEKSIGNNSAMLATELLTHIDRCLYGRIETFQGYSRDLNVQKILTESNREFEKIDDISAYIEEKDLQWTSAAKGEITDFMQELIDNVLSEELIEKTSFYEEKYGYKVFAEVFVTNRHGANAAQTQRTTDYYQADEDWWQRAKKDGLHVSNVEYDESADVYSTDICIRIDDDANNFLGVMKVILNIEETIRIIKEASNASKYETTCYELINKEGKVIYDTQDHPVFEGVPKEVFSRFGKAKHPEYFVLVEPGEKEKLIAHSHSKAFKDYKGLGWTLVLGLETKEIFAPVTRLRNLLLAVILTLILIFALIGSFIFYSVFVPLGKLKSAIAGISEGKLSTRIIIESKDEFGYLANSFNKMTEDLETTTTSVDNLNKEITERKQAEEALLESEARHRILYESSRDAIMMLAPPTWKFVAGNQATIELFRAQNEEEFISKGPWDTSPEYQPDGQLSSDKAKAMIGHAMKEGSHFFEWQHMKLDGKEFPATVLLTRIELEGEQMLQATVRNITDRKQVEEGLRKAHDELEDRVQERTAELTRTNEALESEITERKKAEEKQAKLLEQVENINRELKDFASIVSHDLKAPLRGIKTLANWILSDCSDKLGDEAIEQMNLLLERVERMYNLIEGVLQYSRAGRAEGKRVQVNLNDFVPEIINMVVPPESITVTIEDELPVIKCEEIHVMQIFQNLLSNAIKYMDKPQGRIQVGCVEQDGFWKFSIADNGPGIEEKHFERIFKIFQALPTSPDFQGTGVGLTVTKKLVELYNGKVWVESKVGEGSTFFFTLPKQEIEASNEKLEAHIAC